MRIIASPTVQLGLDLQYPSARLTYGVLEFVGIHRRPLLLTFQNFHCCLAGPLRPAAASRGLHDGSSRPRLLRDLRPTHSAPRPDTGLPPEPDWPSGPDGRSAGWFPRSPNDRSVREAPSSTPAASPRLRRRPSTRPPHRHPKTASESTTTTNPLEGVRGGGCALHPGPYPPDSSRLNGYGASTTGSLTLYLLTLLDEPAPSGSASASRLCRGRLPPSPAFPGSGCPQLLPRRCDGPRETVSHHLSIYQRLVAHLTGVHDEHDGDIRGEDDRRRLVFTLTL